MTKESSLLITSHHCIIKGLFTIIYFTQYIMSTIQQNIIGHTKRQKHSLKRQQASEPDPNMVGTLKLSEHMFKNN